MINITFNSHTGDFMAYRKKTLNKPIRVTVILEEEHFEHVRQAAIELSVKLRRTITATEAMRIALEECYPLPKIPSENEEWKSCKAIENGKNSEKIAI